MALDGFYPLRGHLTTAEVDSLGLAGPAARVGVTRTEDGRTLRVMAVYAGVKRPPRKGERYLSGATVGAWLAPNDLSRPYHIARLALTEEVTVVREVSVTKEVQQ